MPNFVQINSKVAKADVVPGQQVISRRGAMLGYTGDVGFYPAMSGQGSGGFGSPGGVMGMAGRMMAGEHVPLMVGDGHGEVYYGYAGLHVTLVKLQGETLSVESDRVLAHDASLSSAVVFLGSQGGIRGAVRGAVTGQGLFTTQLTGYGDVALLSHGGTIELQVGAGRQVAVDPQAYVAHTGQVTLDVTASVGWREAVGRGSGEAIQLKAGGQGVIYVQASEQKF